MQFGTVKASSGDTKGATRPAISQRNDVTNLPAPKPCKISNGVEAAEEGGTEQIGRTPATPIHHDS